MDNPLARFREFILSPSHSRTIGAVVILIIAAAIPLTVLVAQKQQEVRQNAATTTYYPSSYYCTYGGATAGSYKDTSTGKCTAGTYTGFYHSPTCITTATDVGKTVLIQPCTYVYYASSDCSGSNAGYNKCTPVTVTAITTNPSPTTSTSPSPTPTATPNSSGIVGAATTYCGIPNLATNGAPPGITTPPPGSVNDANISSAFFTWTRPTSGNYVYLTYTAPNFASDTYLVGTSNSFYAPRAAGSTFPRPDGTNITYTQCTATDQSGTGFACGFVNGSTVNWTLNECSGTTGASCSTIKSTWSGSFTAATCNAANLCTNGATQCSSTGIPQTCTNGTWVNGNACPTGQTCNTSTGVCTASGPPVCGVFSVPGSANLSQTYTLSFTCDNTVTSYTWNTSSGTYSNGTGTINTGTSNSTSWTAPSTVPTSQSSNVGVSACNSVGCTTASGTIPINIPNCNSGLQTTSACVATTANTCSANNGTQTAQYTTYNGSTTCNPVNITQTCTVSSCSVGNVCTNGACVAQTCTNGATQCSSTGIPQTCTNGTWVNGNACTSGQVCTNGTCVNTCTAPNVACNGACVNTQTDSNNCGTCGNACTAGQTCNSGTCGLIPGHTYIALRVGMDAIGSAGDNENPNPSSSNQSPQHTTRNLAVQIFDSNNSQVFAQVGSINYNATSGVFLGTVDLGASFANGNYIVKVKSDGHLRRIIPGIQNLSSSLTQPIQLPGVSLVAGDIDSNNALNINDYNILLSCVTSPFIANIDNHALCNSNANYVKLSDLEDNGVVNEFDYNLFLREYSVQNGD